MSGGEASRTAMANRNHATMFFTVAPKPDIDDSAATAAFARAAAHLAALPAAPASTPGYRLFWARGDEVGHRDVGAADHVIVGRHSSCDVALPAAVELSLRHLLVAVTRFPDGSLGLRVLDLRASLPFYTDDGQPRRSIVAMGPVVLRLGTYLFGGIPIGPDVAAPLLPAEMPRAIVTCAPGSGADESSGQAGSGAEHSTMGADEDDYFDPPPAPDRPAALTPSLPPTPSWPATPVSPIAPPPPSSASSSSALLSRVTVVPPTALLTEVVRPEATTAFARLTLLRDGHSASIDLPEPELDAGVLIGRSERCTDGGLRRVLDGNISRVHVLLLREGSDVVAYDLCSTQGTYHNAESIRSHRVPPAGGCLSLARTNPVMLCLYPRAQAPGRGTPDPGP